MLTCKRCNYSKRQKDSQFENLAASSQYQQDLDDLSSTDESEIEGARKKELNWILEVTMNSEDFEIHFLIFFINAVLKGNQMTRIHDCKVMFLVLMSFYTQRMQHKLIFYPSLCQKDTLPEH